MPFKKDGDNKVLLWWPSISLHTWNFFHWSKTCRKNPQQKVPPKWFNSCPFYPLIGGHVLTIPKKSRFHHPQKMKNILNQGIRLYKIEKRSLLESPGPLRFLWPMGFPRDLFRFHPFHSQFMTYCWWLPFLLWKKSNNGNVLQVHLATSIVLMCKSASSSWIDLCLSQDSTWTKPWCAWVT